MLSKLINSLENLDFNAIIREALQEVEHVILDTITQDQLYDKGVNSEGVEMSAYAPYRPLTISIKRDLGQPTDRVTLNFTGEFHTSIYVDFESDGVVFRSDDPKFKDLKWQYGNKILGLTPDNMNWISRDYIQPKIINRLKKWS